MKKIFKFISKMVNGLAFLIVILGFSGLLVVFFSYQATYSSKLEIITIENHNIEVNKSNNGNTYFFETEEMLSKEYVVLLGFSIKNQDSDIVHLTAIDPLIAYIVVIYNDYQANVVASTRN